MHAIWTGKISPAPQMVYYKAVLVARLLIFSVLAGVETILVDRNSPDKKGRRAGPDATRKCADRWLAAERYVELVTPDNTGVDLNDILLSRREAS